MNNKTHKPAVLLVLGMAGSGKSTFTQRVIAEAEEREYELKSVNLDPAVGGGKSEGQEEEVEEGFEDWCHGIPYDPNVDIRDSIDYKKLMKGNELGPNGAIMLSLNMYSTRLNDLSSVVERWRDNKVDFVCVDTPGQIEVFTWSASGTLFTEMFARIMPTVLVFVVDTVSMQSASTFVSVLFHACGVMLRTQLPMVLVFNKTDLRSAEEQFNWIEDLDSLQTALDEESDDTQYMANLSSSVSLMMHEFLDSIHKCAVSSVTGEGMDDFFIQVQLAANEFDDGKVEDEAPKQPAAIVRPFAAPTLQDVGENFVDKPAVAAKQTQEEEEALPTRPTEELSLQKTKQLNAEAYLKRKYAEFDAEPSSKRAPAAAPAPVFWFCSQCELENVGAFCSHCLECAPFMPAWFCSICHIENTGAMCKACMGDAPLVGSSQGPVSGSASKPRSSSVASSSRRSSQIAKLPNWICFSCTFFNTHGGGTCEICNSSQLTNNKLKQQQSSLMWTCPQCQLDIHHDTKVCPQCSTVAPVVGKEEDKKEVPPAVVAPFKDGEIVEDMIWSEKEARFFPLNSTRDGRFDETQVKLPEEEEEEVSYDYEDVDDEE